MKYIGLLLLVLLLAMLNTMKAQTASTVTPSKFYTAHVSQALNTGNHPLPASHEQRLPGNSAVPKKAKDLANANAQASPGNDKSLPSASPIDVAEIRRRNEKYNKASEKE